MGQRRKIQIRSRRKKSSKTRACSRCCWQKPHSNSRRAGQPRVVGSWTISRLLPPFPHQCWGIFSVSIIFCVRSSSGRDLLAASSPGSSVAACCSSRGPAPRPPLARCATRSRSRGTSRKYVLPRALTSSPPAAAIGREAVAPWMHYDELTAGGSRGSCLGPSSVGCCTAATWGGDG